MKVCKVCGIGITRRIQINHYNRSLMCKFCYSDYQKEQWNFQKDKILEKRKSERKSIIYKKKCSWCFTEFETNIPSKKSCSSECQRLRKNLLNKIQGKKKYNAKIEEIKKNKS